jgi:two-component system chemotaxis sensor kinase CheA
MPTEHPSTAPAVAVAVLPPDLLGVPASLPDLPSPGIGLPPQLLPVEDLPRTSLGIRVKLVGLMVTTSFLIVGVLASYFPARQIAELRSGLRDRAATYGRLASLQLRSSVAFNDQQTAREVLGAIAKDPLVIGAALYTENGSRLESEGDLSELAQATRRGFGEPRTFYLPGRVLGSALAARDHLIRAALGVGAGALLLGTILAWGIARSLASRVEGIARAASAVAKGDLEQRLDLSGPQDEIGILAHGFDAMVRRLRELIRHIHDAAREEKNRLELLVQERTSELDRRNADLHLVLDNVEQGFVTIDRDANVVGECSRIVDVWLGQPSVGDSLWTCIDIASPKSGANFDVAWSQLVEGFIPAEVCLAQMPSKLSVSGRHLQFEYKPLGSNEDFEKLLVVITDMTAVVERNRTEQEQRDILDVSARLLNDRAGFLEFFGETQVLIERVTKNRSDLVLLKRDLHTLKGNTAMFGLSLASSLCHVTESEIEANGGGPVDCSPIVAQWERTCSKIRHLLGGRPQGAIEVDEREYLAVLDAIRGGVDKKLLERMVNAWRLEPMRVRLERAGEQLSAAVTRFGKGSVEVVVEALHVYLPRDELTEFWRVFAHVVRNAAVHGLEPEAERERLGKPRQARFELRSGVAHDRLFVEIADSGPGVDWDAVRARAAQRGLPATTDSDLSNARFVDGISTTDDATEMSGRGVGLSAVLAACERRHGKIEVTTERGAGTKFRFSWPTTEFKNFVQFELGASL